MSALMNIVGVSLGEWHSLAVNENGILYSWGDNYDGELGNASIEYSSTPIIVMKNVLLPSLPILQPVQPVSSLTAIPSSSTYTYQW